jgi:predicted permease
VRWTRFFRRDQWDEERARELEAYLEIETDENIARGMPPEEARYAALRKLGNTALIREEIYRTNSLQSLDALAYDLRFAWRLLQRNPGLTAVVLMTLAIGIGANTAIFSVVNAVLLRPLPFAEPNRLVFLTESNPEIPEMYVSMPNLRDWQRMNTVFESLAAARHHGATLTGRGEPQRLSIRELTANFFPTLGVPAIIGRTFRIDDDRVDSRPTVVLSETFWNREFERDPRVLGMQLELDGQLYTVIGVVPARGLRVVWNGDDVAAYTSLGRLENVAGGRADHYGIYAYARLKPGVTVETARLEMLNIAVRLEKRYPGTNLGQSASVFPLLAERVESMRRPLLLLMGAVALVLLVACANVANLLTALATVRRREIAVRSALGAGAGRLVRQFVCESVLLSLMGGALGLLAAYCATAAASEALQHLPVSFLPRIYEISVDHSVLFFTLAVSLLTGLLFGVFPAIYAYRTDPNEVLEENSRICTGLPGMRLRNCLVATELALSVVLLVCAGLMIKSLFHVMQADPGFQTDGVLTGALALPPLKYPTSTRVRELVRHLTTEITALPEVEAAGLTWPLLGANEEAFVVEGQPWPAAGSEPYTEISLVTPGALEAMGVRLLYGRYFNPSDDQNAKPVCLVDERLAESYWHGPTAIGKRISILETPTEPPQWATIVGVVRHVENTASGGPVLPGTYFPFTQRRVNGGVVVVRSRRDPTALTKAIRTVLHSLDPDLALYDVKPLSRLTSDHVAPRRLAVTLLCTLAGIALILATVGTYGVMAYIITGRTQEIGLRRVLGATPRDVLRLVLSQGMRVAFAGVFAGVITSLALGNVVRPMLFGVSASDPMTFASVGGILITVAAVACYVPAQKAARLDPIEAVRHE